MKGTEQFKQTIKNYLDNRAAEDKLFRAKYETTTRTIDDVATYIFNEVQKSGCCGFADEEIFSMAVHVIDEPTLEIGKPLNGSVVVNHHIELTRKRRSRKPSPSNAIRTRNCASCRHGTPSRKRSNRKRTSNPNYHFLISKP